MREAVLGQRSKRFDKTMKFFFGLLTLTSSSLLLVKMTVAGVEVDLSGCSL